MLPIKTISLTFRALSDDGRVLQEIPHFERLAPALQQHFMCTADRPVVFAEE